MKGVIYARYSSDNQREESIEGQLRECKAFAEKNSIQIIDNYIDRALSAKTDNRPAFQKMITDSAKEQFGVIIVLWLKHFRELDPQNPKHRKRMVDTFVNAVILYDDRIEFYFNFKNNAKVLTKDDLEKGSDLFAYAPPLTKTVSIIRYLPSLSFISYSSDKRYSKASVSRFKR